MTSLFVGLTERLDVEVSVAEVEKFAALSGDVSPIHVNDGYARSKGFLGQVAHGMLLGAYVSALVGTQLPGKHGILQSCELEFRAPLVPPDKIQITGEVTAVSVGTGQIVLKITVKSVAGTLLATGKVKSVVREPADGAPWSI